MKFLVCKVNTSKDFDKIGKIADQFGITPRGIVGFFDDRIEWHDAMAEFGTLVNATMTRKIVRTAHGLVKLGVYKNNFSFGRFHFNCESHDESEIDAHNYKNDLGYGRGAAWRYVDALTEEPEVESIPIVETPIRFIDSLALIKPDSTILSYTTDALMPLPIDSTATLIPNRLVVTDDLWYVVSEDQMFGFCIIPFFQGAPILIQDNINISPMRNNMSEDCYVINYSITMVTDDESKTVNYVVYLDEYDNVSRVLSDYVMDIPIDSKFTLSEKFREIKPPKEETLFYHHGIKSIMGC